MLYQISNYKCREQSTSKANALDPKYVLSVNSASVWWGWGGEGCGGHHDGIMTKGRHIFSLSSEFGV
jgi:hypothetical protein